jgi:hypothetical protein
MREAARGSTARGRLVALAALALLSPVGCGGAATQASVPLTWWPTSQMNLNAVAGDLPTAAVYVGEVTDRRRDPGPLVGENLEEEGKPVPVYAETDPVVFLRDATRLLFERSGLQVVDDAGAAERIVAIDLETFWTQETDNYDSQVRATFHVSDRSGKELWKGTVNGAARTWGRSLKAENYQQVFSDGTVKMIEGLLSNAGFRGALRSDPARASGGS